MSKVMGNSCRIVALCLLAWSTGPAQASELIYRPVNPNFGGNPLNGRFLLDQAILQDTFKDPKLSGPNSRPSSGQSFAERLDRSILSRLTRDIVLNAFGEGGVSEGTYDTGVNTIVIETTLDATIVRITDNQTGETTTVEVPFF